MINRRIVSYEDILLNTNKRSTFRKMKSRVISTKERSGSNLSDKLNEIAKADNVTVSTLVRFILEQYVNKRLKKK